MTQKQRLSLLILLAVGATFYFLKVAYWSLEAPTTAMSKHRIEEDVTAAMEEAAPIATDTSTTVTPAETTPIEKHIGDFPKNISETYRREIEQDPHRTPAALIKASAHLYTIAQAVLNEQDAEAAFDFFAQCTTAPESVIAVQTACFRHARKISQTYPQFSEKFFALKQQTQEEVLRIVHMDHH